MKSANIRYLIGVDHPDALRDEQTVALLDLEEDVLEISFRPGR